MYSILYMNQRATARSRSAPDGFGDPLMDFLSVIVIILDAGDAVFVVEKLVKHLSRKR